MTSHGASTSPLASRLKRAAMALGALALLVGGAFGARALTSAQTPALAALPSDNVPASARGAQVLGKHNPSAQLEVGLIMKPNHEADLDALLANLYDPQSPQYHQWVPTGDFEARFGPTAAQIAQVNAYMASAGLHPAPDNYNAFSRRYVGSTDAVQRAFHTQINDYRTRDGRVGYGNASAPAVSPSIASLIQGVEGLDTLTTRHTYIAHPKTVNGKRPHYGGAPNGTGLTPQQMRSIYDVTPMYAHTQGAGYILGVYELSNWRLSDFQQYEKQFGLPNVKLAFENIHGGPQSDHSGASEVVLDLDMQLAMAPGVSELYVYDAPNTSIDAVDEYGFIAHQNAVSALSVSWGLCEADTTSSDRYAEMTYLKQMAAQGQSVFASAGDTGAFDCYRDYPNPPYPSYYTSTQVDDPASQIYMTGVGGTSFYQSDSSGETGFDPGTNPNPGYPGNTKEFVWNSFNLCHSYPITINGSNYYCPYGAGGGGSSREWAMPSSQFGNGSDGVVSSYTHYGRWCEQASTVRCREVPDVSMNADPNSGYGIYCTDPGDSYCAQYPGWIQYGGTSAAAPLWAGIAALGDGYHHRRLGLFNAQLYSIMRLSNGYSYYFHDMNTAGKEYYPPSGITFAINGNGYYPMTTDYDQATGIGTPDVYHVAVGM